MAEYRRNYLITGGAVCIVLLYDGEEFFVRALRHNDGNRRVFLTPKIPITTTDLLRLCQHGDQVFEAQGF